MSADDLLRQWQDEFAALLRGDAWLPAGEVAVGAPAEASHVPSKRTRHAPARRTAKPIHQPFEQVALVLQGGGALGSYQAGVVQALLEREIEPHWVAGISIGALNAALIAGNPPEQRLDALQAFWDTICRPALPMPWLDAWQDWVVQSAPQVQRFFSATAALRAAAEGQRAFFSPRGVWPWLGLDEGPEASFYDTSALKTTLERLVDFDRVNDGPMRVSVGAVNVRTGNLEYFDNRGRHGPHRLRAEHFMASGALPPAFGAEEIDGEHYWDGGLVSNTPLQHVLDEAPDRSTVAFQVDLWRAKGPLPRNIYEVQARIKDIQYSSRTRAGTSRAGESRLLGNVLQRLLTQVPKDARQSDIWCRLAQRLGGVAPVSVVHLIYQEKEWEGLAKDYEFSPRTMRLHWHVGLQDARAALSHDNWWTGCHTDDAFATHDVRRIAASEVA